MDIFGIKQLKQELEEQRNAVIGFGKLRKEDQEKIDTLQNSRKLLKGEIEAYKVNREVQDNFAQELQNLTLTISQDTVHRDSSGVERRWKNYASATAEISARYEKEACIGNIYTDPIINARVAFIVGDNIEQQ